MLKDASKPFPTGRPVGVLRWSYSATGETALPLTINCWPEDEGDGINVNIEYSLQRPITLHNVEVDPSAAPRGARATRAPRNAPSFSADVAWVGGAPFARRTLLRDSDP